MTAVGSPRSIPVHQALIQPLLVLGAERELVATSAVLSAMLIFSLANAYCAVAGIILWIVSVAVFQRLAKLDPQMSRVYLRHVRYRGYYAAQSHPIALTREQRGIS